MSTTRPTLAPEPASRAKTLVGHEHPTHHPSLFFDDHAAVMYRKIDTNSSIRCFPSTSDRAEFSLRLSAGKARPRRGPRSWRRGCHRSFSQG